MKFQSGGAFRRALEDRLNTKAKRSGLPLIRLRKMVAFDRFLARLMVAQSEEWALKGGLALQLRLGERSRTTKDVDLLALISTEKVLESLREAASLDLHDWFQFQVAEPAQVPFTEKEAKRYPLSSMLDGRSFERFHIDIGIGDAVVEPFELLPITDLLEFAGLSPTKVPCYPVSQQIAEKLHAYTKPRGSGTSSRVKDLVDLVLLSEMRSFSISQLRLAVQATFLAEKTHAIPLVIPEPPRRWESEFRKICVDLGLGFLSLSQAHKKVQTFLGPVLTQETDLTWDPADQIWRP